MLLLLIVLLGIQVISNLLLTFNIVFSCCFHSICPPYFSFEKVIQPLPAHNESWDMVGWFLHSTGKESLLQLSQDAARNWDTVCLIPPGMHETSCPSCSFLLPWSCPPPHACPVLRQVFGVLDSPEYSGVNTGVYRPVINDGKDEQANLPSDGSTVDPLHGFIPAAISGPPTGPIQVKPPENLTRTGENTCSMFWSQCMQTDVVTPRVSAVTSYIWSHTSAVVLMLSILLFCCPGSTCPCSRSGRTQMGFPLGQSGRQLCWARFHATSRGMSGR